MSIRSNPTSILITGATSGIGFAIAECYAKAGVTLHLAGRDAARLDDVINRCESLGSKAIGKIINVCDKQALDDWISESHVIKPLDLVIANAGISLGTMGDIDFEKTRDIFMVNLVGVLNTIHPAIKVMRANKGGQIALVSSMAGYRGLPSAPAYSASKSAVKAYGEALRGQLSSEQIDVSVICPGFVKSGITDKNNFAMPFFMEAPKAAAIIKQGLSKNKALNAFPWQMRAISYLLLVLPTTIAVRLLSKLPAKN